MNSFFLLLAYQIQLIRLLASFMQYFIFIYKKYQIRYVRGIIIFSLGLTIYFLYNTYDKPEYDHSNNIEPFSMQIFDTNKSIYIPLSKVNYQSPHLVLLWTDLFDNIYWHQKSFFNTSTIVSCSAIHQCQFTRDKRKLSQSSLVAFHLYDINRHQLPERKKSKNDNQNWIFITGESPINFYYQNPSFSSYMLDNYFDRSISYKYDSPFAIFSPTIKSRISSKENFNSSYLYKEITQREQQLNIDSLKYKKKAIVWIVSNCNTFSQREKYVEELKKFISIDIYGKCGTPCSQANNRQCNIDLRDYYFYLSFENSRCNSYITEKFWNIITNNTHRLVPIVMGARENDYARTAPKQSYIHVDMYKTPEDLAKHLNHLINKTEEYLKYLQWREDTQIEVITRGRWMNFLCPLCEMAYESPQLSQTRLNFSSWYNPKTECHHNDVKIFTQCKQATLNVWMSWAHNIKCP
jgi:hypothetical protein